MSLAREARRRELVSRGSNEVGIRADGRYVHGFSAALGLYGFCVLLAVVMTIQYAYSNRHNLGDAGKQAIGHVHVDEGESGDAEVHKVFQYPT